MRFRLKEGGRIDRTKRLRFTFNGRSFEGFAGDTLASALIANGTHLTSRSFKYHRPRGILTAGAEEPSALVQLGTGARTEPNLRATQVELYDGLTAYRRQCLAERQLRPCRLDRAARAALPRRLLLQDLPLAGVVLEVALRARHPAHGGARPRARSTRSRLLRQDVCPLRRARGGRRAGGDRCGARRRREPARGSCSWTSRRRSAAR